MTKRKITHLHFSSNLQHFTKQKSNIKKEIINTTLTTKGYILTSRNKKGLLTISVNKPFLILHTDQSRYYHLQKLHKNYKRSNRQ